MILWGIGFVRRRGRADLLRRGGERVRVVRVGGQYLEEREQRFWLLLVFTLALAVVALMNLVGNYGTVLMWLGA